MSRTHSPRFIFASLFPAAISAILILAGSSAEAQRITSRTPTNQSVNVHIHLRCNGEHQTPGQVHVEVLDNGMPVANVMSDRNGNAEVVVPPDNYTIRVTGDNIEEFDSETFFVDGSAPYATETFVLKWKDDGEISPNAPGPSISMAEMNAPDKARKEKDKGLKALEKNDLTSARKHLEKAVDIYPAYPSALNNLGIIAMQQDRRGDGEDYFRRAILADDKYAPAFLNMARMKMDTKEFAQAETLLLKANAADPVNLEVLAMLAEAELMNGELNLAVSTMQKVHSQPHDQFTVVHVIAAQAYEREQLPKKAVEQYETFLMETPNTPSADKVRQAIAYDEALAARQQPTR